ncbi:hypothetical protein D3C75_1054170 [compost metagenome]
MHVDDAAFVKNSQVHGLASQFVDAAHARFRLADYVQVGQGLRAQLKQPNAEPIAIFGILNHVAASDFRHAAFLGMLGQRFKDGHSPSDGGNQFVVLNDAVVHGGSNWNGKPKDIR